jgi:hypothetical protein
MIKYTLVITCCLFLKAYGGLIVDSAAVFKESSNPEVYILSVSNGENDADPTFAGGASWMNVNYMPYISGSPGGVGYFSATSALAAWRTAFYFVQLNDTINAALVTSADAFCDNGVDSSEWLDFSAFSASPNDLINFYMGYWIDDGLNGVYGWAELVYDGTTLTLVDSAAENDGVGIIAGQYQQVPEPATLLLFGLGGLGAWLLRRNKRHSDRP